MVRSFFLLMKYGQSRGVSVKMKLLKFLFVLVVLANIGILSYCILDSKETRRQMAGIDQRMAEINKIRVELPDEFRKEVATGVIASSKEMAKKTFQDAGRTVSSEVRRVNMEAVSNMTNAYQTTMAKMDESAAAIHQLWVDQQALLTKKAAEAEATYSLYEQNATNENAFLYLQVAIRKNPAELKYVRAMWDLVKKSGMDSGLVQMYQAMLQYSLDEAPIACFDSLAAMVKDLRVEIAEEMQRKSDREAQENAVAIADLNEQLSTNELILAFSDEALEVAERRMEVCKELMEIDEDGDYKDALASAEMIRLVTNSGKQINGYLAQVTNELATVDVRYMSADGVMNVTTNELKESFATLSAMAVEQPLVLAQQAVRSLYGLDLSGQTSDVRNACVEEFRRLDGEVRKCLGEVDHKKATMIRDYVTRQYAENGISDVTQLYDSMYTKQLKTLEEIGKVATLYIGAIANQEIANEVLGAQIAGLAEDVRKTQQARMKRYQEKSAYEMKLIAEELKSYKGNAPLMGKVDYCWEKAKPLLYRLVRIDPLLLVPEICELYQYEESQLMMDVDAWVKKETRYEVKAELMKYLSEEIKMKLEDL